MTIHRTHATAEGTARYRDRFADRPGHFRQAQGLWLSSIGLGTYLGDATDAIDKAYAPAIVRAVSTRLQRHRHRHQLSPSTQRTRDRQSAQAPAQRRRHPAR